MALPWEKYQGTAVTDSPPWEKYQNAAATDSPPWEKYTPTAVDLSTLEAPEGSPQREDINRAVAGNLFAPPGVFARDPTLAELIDSAMPSGVKESMRDERRIPLAPPLPEQGAFEQGGVLPYVAGVAQTVEGLVPHSWDQAGEMIKPPMGGIDIEKENELGRAWRGELGPVAQAAAISGTAFQALPLAHLPFAESPFKADVDLVNQIKELRKIPEPPPTVSLGPGTTAADVSRALERRFTLQDTPPEAPPDLAPSPPIEQTLPNIGQPLPFNPELGPQPQPDFQMPLQTDMAQSPNAQPLFPTPPPGTPLKGTPLVDANGNTPAAKVAAQAAVPPEVQARVANLPEYMQQNVLNNAARLEKSGVADQIEELAAQRLTAKQISDKLGIPIEDVMAIRITRGIPSMNAGGAAIAGYGGGPQFSPEFEAWVKSRQAPEAPVQTPVLPNGGVPVAETSPEPYTPEAAAQRAAQQSSGAEPPPVAETVKAGTDEGGISIKNEYTDTQRRILGFPEAVKEASRDFGTVWNEAEATDRLDPGAKGRLVEAINEGNVKALSDHDDALLLREQIRAQGERDDAAKSVNEAATDADRTAAKARLEQARDDLQAVYDADRKAGRSTAQGLNARKMLAKEDYSLMSMEARKRAANNGEPLSEEQLEHTEALHAEIAEASNGLDALEQLRREGKQGATSGKRFTDVLNEQAQKARERLISKRGRLNAGIDPTNLVDEAIIGASHIANGLTKFADWSAQMVRDFGDRIKPFLKDLWDRARTYHDATKKASRSPEEIRLERYKTRMAKDTAGVTAKIQREDFTKQARQPLALDPAAFKMKGNLQRLKNEFERGVAKDAYNKMSPGDKFWQHFVGVERAMKLSSPGVFEKLGLAAAVREVLAPVEAAGGYAASTFFPRLAKGTRYGADLGTLTRAELKAKASLFSEGMKDAWENLKGKETGLEAMSDKYGRQPDFWYNRIGKIHAAVKAPIKRAEFVRSLEHRIDAAVKAGEDINHPAVMDRLATESALDANRAIFQQNTIVSNFFSMLDKASPAGGRAARFLFPVVKIPVNLFKEFVTYNVGGPVAAARIGHAYWKGVETLEPAAREAIIRQLVKGSAGGAAILWGYYNKDKVHDFFSSVPPWFEHTPIAMAIHEGSIIGNLEEQGQGTKYRPTEGWKDATKMAKYDIPFAYTVSGLTGALDPSNPDGWRKYLYDMIQGSVVPQISSWTAKELDKPTPFNPFDKPTYRPPTNIAEAVTQGIPGLREDVPEYHPKRKH